MSFPEAILHLWPVIIVLAFFAFLYLGLAILTKLEERANFPFDEDDLG